MSVFKKQEERKQRLLELSKKYAYEALLQLASDLFINSDTLLRITGGLQGIEPGLGRKIDYLWQIKLGKVGVKVPPSICELIPPTEKPPEEEIPSEEIFEIEKPVIECSIFTYIDYMFGNKDKYWSPTQTDKLTKEIDKSGYDGALTRVRPRINEIFNGFFGRKNEKYN